jgi:hypothetical protein
MAGDDPAHLRMSFDDLAERPSIGRGKTDIVKCRDPRLGVK